MAERLPALRPQCPEHGVYMVLRDHFGLTKEQSWCGVWYDCPAYRCRSSHLLPSAALRQRFAAMTARLDDALELARVDSTEKIT